MSLGQALLRHLRAQHTAKVQAFCPENGGKLPGIFIWLIAVFPWATLDLASLRNYLGPLQHPSQVPEPP